MKILVICNFSSGLIKFRGMLLETWVKQNYSLSVIVPESDDIDENKSDDEISAIGCNLIHIPMERRGMNPVRDICLLRNYIKVIKSQKPDLVITYTIKPNIYGGIACRLCKTTYAVNITGLGSAFQKNGMLRKFVTSLYKISLHKAKIVFFENEENRQVFVDAGIIDKKNTHVLNGAGVDLEKFSYIEYPNDCDCTRFLFIGRVMQEKGIDELFSAMRRLQADGINCSLDILGGFDEDYSDVIKKYESEGWLKYHGYQSDVRGFIAKCHCFVLPSWHEGMANSNLECAASGRPIITSNIHGCLEAVEDGKTGFLCAPKNAESLYNAMKKFVFLPYKEKTDFGKSARKRMEEIFDKKKVVEKTILELKR